MGMKKYPKDQHNLTKFGLDEEVYLSYIIKFSTSLVVCFPDFCLKYWTTLAVNSAPFSIIDIQCTFMKKNIAYIHI